MSIQSEINRINDNVAAAYSALEDKGAILPETRNLNNLAPTIANIQNLQAGDGITIQEDTIRVTTPVKGVTHEEYDALSEEERNTGLYVVTDANINLNDHGDVYSTEETRIGTWIDGKPLYRIVIVYEVKKVGNDQNIKDLSLLNIEELTHFQPIVQGAQGHPGSKYPIGITVPAFQSFINANFISISVPDSVYLNQRVTFIIEYTKTTDPTPTTLLTSQVPLPQKVTVPSSSISSDSPLTATFPIVNSIASASASGTSFHFAPASASATTFTLRGA